MKVVCEVEELERDRKKESQQASKEIFKLRSELRSLEDAKEKGEKELHAILSLTRVDLSEQTELVQALEEKKRQEEHRNEVNIAYSDTTASCLTLIPPRWLV